MKSKNLQTATFVSVDFSICLVPENNSVKSWPCKYTRKSDHFKLPGLKPGIGCTTMNHYESSKTKSSHAMCIGFKLTHFDAHVIVSDFVLGHENRSKVTLFDDTNAISFLFTNMSLCDDVQ